MCIRDLFFNFFWKIKKKKDWSDPQPDSAIQPKARGLLHMEREYFAHHIWSRFRGLSTSQPRSNRKYLKNYSTFLKEDPENVLATWSTRGRPTKVLDVCRTRLWRARALVRPGAVGLLIGIECFRGRDSSCIYLTSFVTTRIGVELAAVQRKLPDCPPGYIRAGRDPLETHLYLRQYKPPHMT